MNLKHWIIKKLGGFTENEVRYMVKNIPIHNSHPETFYYGRSSSMIEEMIEMGNKTVDKFIDDVFLESYKLGTDITSKNVTKVFKDAIKKLKLTNQLPMINGVQLTQEDLNN